jgi:hypothetical protein
MPTARTLHCQQHVRHVGTCPACQRARLEAEKQQLAEVEAIKAASVPDLGRLGALGAAQPAPAQGALQ